MNWLKLIITYLPVIIAAVKAIEDAMGEFPGTEKKSVVLDIVKGSSAGPGIVPEEQITGISALIDTVVGALNKVGGLKQPNSPATTPPQA